MTCDVDIKIPFSYLFRSTYKYEPHKAISENVLHVIQSPDLSTNSIPLKSYKREVTPPTNYFPILPRGPEKLSKAPSNKYLANVGAMYTLEHMSSVPILTPDSLFIIQHLPQQSLKNGKFKMKSKKFPPELINQGKGYQLRFFERLGNKNTYVSIGNHHLFNKSCHRQTYQNY